jgi:hypothetical protein
MKSPRTIVVKENKDTDLAYRRLWDDLFNIFNGDVSITGNLTVSGTIKSEGGLITNITNIDNTDSPYIALASDHVIVCDTSAGDITVNLPAGVIGTTYSIKNIGTGTVTVDGDGTETIDLELTRKLVQFENLVIKSTYVDWIIV